VSGKIARLVLIQLQFVKKELLVAMQAIDDLFNANQVNLQLLAITPAVLSVLALNVLTKTLWAAVRTTSRGKTVESSAAISRELRNALRSVERVLLLSVSGNTSIAVGSEATGKELSPEDMGRILSGVHRMQGLLVVNSNLFDASTRRQLQVQYMSLSPHCAACMAARLPRKPRS
jgi:nuclear-control-of-ATPase protein 2